MVYALHYNVVSTSPLCGRKTVPVLTSLLVKHLTHWGRLTHICVGRPTIIGSDNGLSPGRRQAIIWTNDEMLLIGPLGTKFSELWISIQTFSFKKMHLKMSPAKWRLFCLGLNVLNGNCHDAPYCMGGSLSQTTGFPLQQLLCFPQHGSHKITMRLKVRITSLIAKLMPSQLLKYSGWSTVNRSIVSRTLSWKPQHVFAFDKIPWCMRKKASEIRL